MKMKVNGRIDIHVHVHVHVQVAWTNVLLKCYFLTDVDSLMDVSVR